MTLKLDENPPIIWPGELSLRDFEGTWWVAHTKSRNEKALAWQMLRKDIPYFLPMSWKVSQRRSRTFKSLLPLFTGYLFFCGSQNDRLEVLKTNRVAGLLDVSDPQRLVDDLEPIEKVLREGAPLEPYEYLREGQRCRIVAGPLMGIEGIVVQTPHKTRLVLQVEMLGQATCVDIERAYIEPTE